MVASMGKTIVCPFNKDYFLFSSRNASDGGDSFIAYVTPPPSL